MKTIDRLSRAYRKQGFRPLDLPSKTTALIANLVSLLLSVLVAALGFALRFWFV